MSDTFLSAADLRERLAGHFPLATVPANRELPGAGPARYFGECLLEISRIGKECHDGCWIRRQVGDCVMPREGFFARVLQGGTVHRGDAIELLPPRCRPARKSEDPGGTSVRLILADRGGGGIAS